MTTIAAFILLFSCLFYPSQADAQKATPQTGTAASWFSEYGFEKLPEVVQWIRQLDTEWDKLVQAEQKAQVLRQLNKIASATAELELQCQKAVSLLQSDADVLPQIRTLEMTVAQLREEMTRLSTNLGGKLGIEGFQIADQFDTFMGERAANLSKAHQILEANKPEDRVAAAEYSKKAALLAREAHEAVVLFINEHNPHK